MTETPTESTQAHKPVILTVDDDPSVSRAVARDLRRHYGESHRILRAASGAEALEALRDLKLRGLPPFREPLLNTATVGESAFAS
jgi:thioredoxin reductase (NADPH)